MSAGDVIELDGHGRARSRGNEELDHGTGLRDCELERGRGRRCGSASPDRRLTFGCEPAPTLVETNPSGLLARLAALANPQRCRILARLAQGPRYVSQLAREVGLSRPLVQVHLRKLEAAGLIRGRLELSDEGKALKFYEVEAFDLRLTPQGIAYVSYNALPGCRLRDLARDVMLFETRDIDDPVEKVRAARAAIKRFAEATDAETFYGAALRERMKQIETIPDNVLYHDDLNPGARAFALHEVLAAAEPAPAGDSVKKAREHP